MFFHSGVANYKHWTIYQMVNSVTIKNDAVVYSTGTNYARQTIDWVVSSAVMIK